MIFDKNTPVGKAFLDQDNQSVKDALKERLKELVRKKMGVSGGWFPLTPGQDALWFLWSIAPKSTAYSMVFPFEVLGDLDAEILQKSIEYLSDRHPCLAMEFRSEEGKVRQRNLANHKVKFVQKDASSWTQEELDESINTAATEPFDLEADATLRTCLFRKSNTSHILLIVVHHIVGDLWSLVNFMDELQTVYAALKSSEPIKLPPLSVTFEEYVYSEIQAKKRGDYDKELAYWKSTLAGEIPILDLPTDHPRVPVQSFEGGTVFASIPSELCGKIEQIAKDADATLYMVLLAAYQVLLHRFSGQETIVVGTPTSGRSQRGLSDLFGDFINILPLRGDFDGGSSFFNVLEQTKFAVIGALKNQRVPFSTLVECLDTTRDLSRSPLFQTTFVLQKFHRYPDLQSTLLPIEGEPDVSFADLKLRPILMAQQHGQYDLNLEMKKDHLGGLNGAWKFSTDLFEAEMISRMAASFEMLLQQIVEKPDCKIEDLALVPTNQVDEVIAKGCGPVIPLPQETTICQLFETHVKQCGDHVAVTHGDEELSYQQLFDQVEPLAKSLASRGVGKEVLVSLVLPRGINLVVAMLAVMKAGGAFLPLSPGTPPARLQEILVSSSTQIVLTDDTFLEGIEGGIRDAGGLNDLLVVSFETLCKDFKDHPLPSTVLGSDLSYIIYTSGSTGAPKGVMVEHEGMINHSIAKLSDLQFDASDALAQNAPQSFDVVVWQCLAPLIVGGRVVIVHDDIAEDPAKLIAEIGLRGITSLQIVPSMMRAFISEAEGMDHIPNLSPLKWIVPTGEALPTELCRRWLKLYPQIPILNTYGSTECSDDQCHYRLDQLAPADEALPIITVGRPIQNMSAYVLDKNLSQVPVGVVGELYIGGIGVGRGYRGDPLKTATAFINDPFRDAPNARLYKTNDMARRRSDGLVDFLGRLDHMIKLNGVRIEPGEIEIAISAYSEVLEAFVLAHPTNTGERQLVAYVVRNANAQENALDHAALRTFLTASLPFTMIPAHFVDLKELPLTANGKLDTKALPVPQFGDAPDHIMVLPRSDLEKELASIWQVVLDQEAIGIHDDFFLRGGDSIRSIQVAARCQTAGYDIKPVDLFLYRDIAALAVYITGASTAPVFVDIVPTVPKVSADQLKQALSQISFDE
ncbi:MAG: amino acid adenylation domain-containing protein [Candidatus Azotimanducaceae bacterium]|jgi:amino acid adenylation domain-containing protein